jgi:uncharacterized Zn-binding protein involved in type VI secretion
MYPFLGDFPTGATIFFPFATYNAAGASVTATGLAVTDIEVYKGASMTQRSSDAGYALVDTDGLDLDGVTGIHGFTIDTSNDTDSGFYAAGNDYTVVVSSITADSQTVNFIAGRFSIENRNIKANVTQWLTQAVAAVSVNGVPEVDVTHIGGSATAATNLSYSAALMIPGVAYAGTLTTTRVDTQTAAIIALDDDILIGRVLIARTGNETYTACRISDFAEAGGVATITLDSNTPLRTAMSNSDAFLIV